VPSAGLPRDLVHRQDHVLHRGKKVHARLLGYVSNEGVDLPHGQHLLGREQLAGRAAQRLDQALQAIDRRGALGALQSEFPTS
jgi:hypothetical protein